MEKSVRDFFFFLVGTSLIAGILLTIYGLWVMMIGGESPEDFKTFGKFANKSGAVFTFLATIYVIYTLKDKKRKGIMWVLIVATAISFILTVWGEVFPNLFVNTFSQLPFSKIKDDDNDVITSSYIFGGLAIAGFAASLLNPKEENPE
ncbi:hypothetical protein [Bacillus cihuensis]|uniref:hypothetical protein n=1 Tax=Bacillus cihuensis TaxID=1208599 RepID=UPI0004265AA0|nr:hypothetical protein [Bacillus cihuensis]